MPTGYTLRTLTVLLLLGVLSAVMSVLSVLLIVQIQSNQCATVTSDTAAKALPSGFSVQVSQVLLPVSTVLTALSLTLNLSCVILCLLHSYFSAEICKEESQHPDRGDWFLLDSRAIRHVAIGLFCLGVSVYLAALSIYMLLLFERETGIASACILASGVIVLLIIVIHSLVKASQVNNRSHPEMTNTMYENDSAHGEDTPAPQQDKTEAPKPKPRPEIHREFSYPPFIEHKSHLSPTVSHSTSVGSHATIPSQKITSTEKDTFVAPRMHRTLSAESGLLQAQTKPWNGVTHEMRTVLARKPGPSGKDSTLV
ncbi:transmembrane protein 221 [Protopterus annectens]|uniref:transmembrane protein 221 n=1 Tax=Protopterus annectens TaxID=7888 RepID=UPI001CFA5440|nr:transmembrane protein 221 [Protopterus annectens]